MPEYRVDLASSVRKELHALPSQVLRDIASKIDSLAFNPRPFGYKKLQGSDGEYRVRVGDYRIVYSVQDRILVVRILRVQHRKNAYR